MFQILEDKSKRDDVQTTVQRSLRVAGVLILSVLAFAGLYLVVQLAE